MRHYYRLADFSRDEILHLLDRSLHHRKHPHSDVLKRKEIVLLFLNPSLRTRASFEVAVRNLGGHATTMGAEAIWPLEAVPGAVMDQHSVEHVNEAAGVLSRYYDGIGIRSLARGHSAEEDIQDMTLGGFISRAQVPTFNMESAMYHPCQALGDLLTIRDLLGDFTGRTITITWSYHPRALPMSVTNSILLAACKVGLAVTLAHPPGFELTPGIMELARATAEKEGAVLEVSHDRLDALTGTEIVYTKSWGGLLRYEDRDAEGRQRGQYQNWIVDREAMSRSKRAYFMHCLPVRRNVVATDEVLDSAASAVMHQAENRLHVQKAIMEWLYGSSDAA